MHAHLNMLRMCVHVCIAFKFVASSIHWTLLSNFLFLDHPQIVNCLKAITKYWNVHAHLHMLRMRACTICSEFWVHSWNLLDNVSSFIKIQLHLVEIWRFVYCLKLCACFHMLCMHVHTCKPTNIINQLERPILTYPESFMNIRLHLSEIFGCVTW